MPASNRRQEGFQDILGKKISSVLKHLISAEFSPNFLPFHCHAQAQQGFQDICGCQFKKNNTQGIQYLNFYGNLIKLVDSYLVMLMDTLDELGLTKDTVVVRTADHGEMGECSDS